MNYTSSDLHLNRVLPTPTVVLDVSRGVDGRLVQTHLGGGRAGPLWLACVVQEEAAHESVGRDAVSMDEANPATSLMALPAQALDAVLRRYAKEVEPGRIAWPPHDAQPRLEFVVAGVRRVVCVVPFTGFGSVHATDWVVSASGEEAPLAAPAKLVCAALRALADALATRRGGAVTP